MTSAQQRLLIDRREEVTQAWLAELLADYPAEANGLFGKSRDQFSNPVGVTFAEQLDLLVGALSAGDESAMAEPVLKVMRIRAVQDLDCRKAAGFPFALRAVLRRLAPTVADDPGLAERIDRLALEAFAAYTECREQLHQIRVNDAYRHVTGQLRRLARLDAERHPELPPESIS